MSSSNNQRQQRQQRDKFYSEEEKIDFSDVLIVPANSSVSSRANVNLEMDYAFKFGGKWRGIGIVASNMDSTGTFSTAKSLAGFGLMTAVHKHYSLDEWKNFLETLEDGNGDGGKQKVLSNITVSCGIGENDIEKANKILQLVQEHGATCDANVGRRLMVDVANGYLEDFQNCLRRIRETDPTLTIFAGNVVTPERTIELLEYADVIKLGIGPGSVCTTRKQTGVGFPQLSCVLDCAPAAEEAGGMVMSDGGICCPGDVSKAFIGGAHMVMIGGLLAGHDQSGGEMFEENGKKFKLFYGMSSAAAQHKWSGGVQEYRSSEGKSVKMPYRGDICTTISDMLGGIRSSCTYVGASNIEMLRERAKFIKVRRTLNEIYRPFEV